MKTSKLVLTIFAVCICINSFAQIDPKVNTFDSIKSLTYTVYQLKTKNNKIIKTSPTILYDYYPIQYPLKKCYYNTKGNLVVKENQSQKDTIYYNSKNQKIKMVLYPNAKKLNDSITFFYAYDIYGNIIAEKTVASSPKLDYYLNGNLYSYKSLINKFYINFYVLEKDSVGIKQFDNEKVELNYYYRLFNNNNQLLKEKYVTTDKNSYPLKVDSTIHSVEYHYNNENKIIKISTIKNHVNALGKTYLTKNTEEHNYLSQGLIHEIKYYNDRNLIMQQRYIHNTKGKLLEYSKHWVSPNKTAIYKYNSNGELKNYIFKRKDKIERNITLQYTYNNKGNWIECIHFNKKSKPKYLIKRGIEYY